MRFVLIETIAAIMTLVLSKDLVLSTIQTSFRGPTTTTKRDGCAEHQSSTRGFKALIQQCVACRSISHLQLATIFEYAEACICDLFVGQQT